MTVLGIAANNLKRLFRQRGNLFFVFVLPLMLILVLGLTIGSDELRIGIHNAGDDSVGVEQLTGGLANVDGIEVVRFESIDEASSDLERSDITALVIIPAAFDDALAAGDSVELEYRVVASGAGLEVKSLVESVVAERDALVRAQHVVTERAGLDSNEAAELVATFSTSLPRVQVNTVDADGGPYLDADAVGFVAAQELVLFMFVIAMVAASAVVRSRQLGVTQRMLATPATSTQVVAGEALGRYTIAVVQGAFIVGASALLFGLDWGSWTATAAIIALFALVATAAALLVGALVNNENQSSAVGISLGLAMAALGGCMVPFEVFPSWLRTLAHVTPHAWAVDAFSEIVQRGGGLGDVGVPAAVLLVYGLVLLTAASVGLKRTITG